MSVHQLKDGRWIVHYRDPEREGKWRREYFGRGLDGERRARDRNEEFELGPYERRTPGEGAITFKKLGEAYLQAKRGHMAQTSLDALHYKLTGVIYPEIGTIEAMRLTAHRIDQYVAKRLPFVKCTTIHRDIADIQAILNWAVSRRYISKNPITGYEKPKRDDSIIAPPTQAEAVGIFANSPPHLVRALALSYYTGLRPGQAELFKMRWSNIDWNLKLILVKSAKKGGLRYRIVPIHPKFIKALRTWWEEDKKRDVEIIRFRGKPISTIKSAYKTAKKKAGITRKLPPYAFRHAFATYVLGHGGDLKSTSEILGHSRPDTTTRIYQHTDLTLHRKAVNKLPPLQLPE